MTPVCIIPTPTDPRRPAVSALQAKKTSSTPSYQQVFFAGLVPLTTALVDNLNCKLHKKRMIGQGAFGAVYEGIESVYVYTYAGFLVRASVCVYVHHASVCI